MKDSNNQIIERKLVQSFEAKELADLSTNYAELGLDSILDNGVFKEIPILKTVASLAKIGFNIRDRIFVNKIYNFLVQVGQTTQEQRDEFVRKHCNNVNRFEEAVMLILEKADRIEKTTLIGKVFKACILGEISYEYALKLSHMVNRAFWGDLQQLIDNLNIEINDHNQSLVDAGLFGMEFTGGGYRARYSSANIKFKISDYGRELFRIANF